MKRERGEDCAGLRRTRGDRVRMVRTLRHCSGYTTEPRDLKTREANRCFKLVLAFVGRDAKLFAGVRVCHDEVDISLHGEYHVCASEDEEGHAEDHVTWEVFGNLHL